MPTGRRRWTCAGNSAITAARRRVAGTIIGAPPLWCRTYSGCHGAALLELNDVALDDLPTTGASMFDIIIDGIVIRSG
ncbi:MAG: hypothetical protein QM673_10115 [Gordonia sp. (in: high G+C Gram-positive bacteria)]